MKNIKLLFEKNNSRIDKKRKIDTIIYDYVFKGRQFGEQQLLELISFCNHMCTRFKHVKLSIFLRFMQPVEIVDKLSYVSTRY